MTKKILVLREFDDFSVILAENGFEIINLPLITTKSFEDLGEFEAKLAAIGDYDGVFLTSAKAAEIFRAKLIEKTVSYGGRIYVLGRRSHEILRNLNLDLCFDESANTAREML
ncbi:MAG: uroporphyrinogen-III synthase, partial [Pyrinomonadaceae bacterium]|nr:uroporphyrinogen-III synthase [Pyrinomonadaceae bacterium]